MAIIIGDIETTWSGIIPTLRSSQVTENPVDGREADQIADHIKNTLPEWSVDCALQGDDKKEKFNNILKFWQDKSLIVVSAENEVYTDLVITNVSEKSKSNNTIKFSISFKPISFAEIKTVRVGLSELEGIIYAMTETGRINQNAEVFEEGTDINRVRVLSGVAGDVIGE